MTNAKDEAITGDIIAILAESPRVRADDIRIYTVDGQVRLQGIVNTLEEKVVAGELAQDICGVRSVQNDLTVSANRDISDMELTRRVQDRLAEENLAGAGAKVVGGNAFLTGVVPDVAVKERAMEVAGSVEGIREVISDDLEISAGRPVDDIKLANSVAEALSEDSRIDVIDLDVRTENGAVYLSGKVAGEDEINTATSIAAAVPGVQRVENFICAGKIFSFGD